jgi:hypothetical protein
MTDRHHDEWAFYIIGILIALSLKCTHYVLEGKKQGREAKDSIHEWFFEKSRDNVVSWGTTIAVIWVFGDCYINQVAFLWPWLNGIPVVKSLSFLFGTLIEYVAPNATKWVVNKISPQ